MHTSLLITSDPYELQAALLEDHHLVEYHFERHSLLHQVGNIYAGVVKRLVPGLDAAFVEIGQERQGFLFLDDLVNPRKRYAMYDQEDGGEEPNACPVRIPISSCLQEGQRLLVQMQREQIGEKGARLTTQISLCGRYLVLLANQAHIGISRRITDPDLRQYLEELAGRLTLLRPDTGLIVRTAAAAQTPAVLEHEWHCLLDRWTTIQAHAQAMRHPGLVHREARLAARLVRDVISENIDQILVDDELTYDEVKAEAANFSPHLMYRVHLYRQELPLFDIDRVEEQLARAQRRRMPLPSGGFLIFDELEALTAIDINTGRFLGEVNLEETALGANLEAIPEIFRQIRLRDLGGILILDCIDMAQPEHRHQVMEAVKAEVLRDRARPTVFPMTDLCLVQLTRKRLRQSLRRSLHQPCPCCDGEGAVFSIDTTAIKVLRRFTQLAALAPEPHPVVITVAPAVAEHILQTYAGQWEELQARCQALLQIVVDPHLLVNRWHESMLAAQ